MSEIKIMHGDNIELLKSLSDNSIDSIVTDCPYGLGKEPNALELIKAWSTVGYLEIKGKGFMGKSWDSFVPQPLFWKEAIRVLKPGGHVAAFFGTRTYDWGVLAMRLAGFEIRDMISWIYGSGFPKSVNCGDGLGTALKPAVEPICIARKPFKGTIKENISIYGTAGLNIDRCRIEFTSEQDKISSVFGRGTDIMAGNFVGSKHSSGKTNIQPNDLGRFPSNVILDPFCAQIMDSQTGVIKSGGGRVGENGKRNYVKNSESNSLSGARSDTKEKFWDEEKQDFYSLGRVVADEGGGSRFFYCAKSSTSERNAGCEHLGLKKTTDGRDVVCDNAFQRGDTERNNGHPTVKPISVMRWIMRLITPKGGKCLDPFAGSGTTGCAAAFEEIDIILMELESDYIPIIEARTKYWQKKANREIYEKELLSAVQTLF